MDEQDADALIAQRLAADWNDMLPAEIAWTPALVAEVRANERAGQDHLSWDPSVCYAVVGIELLDALDAEWTAEDANDASARIVTGYARGDGISHHPVARRPCVARALTTDLFGGHVRRTGP